MYAIDRDDGSLSWQYKTDDDVVSSPTVNEDTVFFGSNDDRIYALNTKDGSVKWNYTTGDDVKSSVAISNGTIYVGSNDNQVYALDEENGTELWTYNAGSSVISSPSIDARQSTLYVGTEKGNILALDVRDGLKKWETKTKSAINGTPSIFGNNIAVGNAAGTMLMLNKFTGENVWSYNPGYIDNFSGSISASPITSGGSLFMVSEDGNVYSLNTDQKVGPVSVYTYYLAALVVIIMAACIAIKKLVVDKRRNK